MKTDARDDYVSLEITNESRRCLGVPLEVEERVIEKIRKRRDVGRAKYGVSMERGDLSLVDWLRHAQEEAMDLAIYLEKAITMAEQERKR